MLASCTALACWAAIILMRINRGFRVSDQSSPDRPPSPWQHLAHFLPTDFGKRDRGRWGSELLSAPRPSPGQ